MDILCGQLLYANGMPVAECAQIRGTEHDHSSDEPWQAVAAGSAHWLTDEIYGPPSPTDPDLWRN